MNQSHWERVERTLQQALDLRPAERPAFLDRACAGDATLRREIDALLQNEQRARSFLETPALAGFVDVPADARAQDLIGQHVGHYRVESLIGMGGMGQVYKARDEQLPRDVALKVMPPEFTADSGRVQRFEQEAIAASQLNHPNIVTILQTLRMNGALVMATEFVEGRTLRQWLTDPTTRLGRRLEVHRALDIAIQVARALKAAHTAWIIHRDIKPENIMVRDDGVVKVLDLGAAKLTRARADRLEEGPADPSTGPEPPVSALQTAPGTLLGTASYMSPEQACGDALDGRTDLFSLGAVLYEMVTGARLFAGATRAEALDAAARNQDPLSGHTLDRVPRELGPVLRKALRRDRRDRYATAGELLDDLLALKRRLDRRLSTRLARISVLSLLLVVSLVGVAGLISRGEVWDERVLRDGHTAAVRQAIFSPDGRRLVSVGEDALIIVWDFARRERVKTLADHTGPVTTVAF